MAFCCISLIFCKGSAGTLVNTEKKVAISFIEIEIRVVCYITTIMDGTGGMALTVPTVSAILFMNGMYYS
jgi:hypothetical protein